MLTNRVVAVLAAAAVLAGCPGGDAPPPATDPQPGAPGAPPAAPAVDLPEGVTQEMVTQGQQLYAGQGICWSCHGQNAEGTALGPALNDTDWIHIDGSFEQIENVIRTGVDRAEQYPGMMPPMGGARLTDDQVRAITAYVYSVSRGR
jgi:mono/diheme cytochrome c family protein